ncbi:class F sortase [Thermobispora bispora]|uniref:class F sortase n=1 Tax=Thermobispora bispora TaxID=2006 RepID=UPI003342483F
MPAAQPVPGAAPGRRSLPQPVLAGMLIAGSLGGIVAVMAGTLALLSPSAEEADPVNAQRAGVSGAALAPTVGPGGTDQPLTAAAATAPPPDPAARPRRPLTLTPKNASAARMTLARTKGRPVRIRIPAIGVSAPVEPVGVDAKGEMQVPPLSKPNLVGWYRLGPAPGEQGPAILLGHVNTRAGAAVFYRLRELKRGNKIAIRRADGKTAIFTVDGIEQVSKLTFPTKRVYGNTATASLRLITCGGLYDAKTHHYTDNVIVYATLTSVV